MHTTLSSKGQVIVPAEIRRRRQWRPGTRLIIEDTPDGILLKAAPLFSPTEPADVFGSLRHHGPAKTVEEMQEGIVEEARRRHARDRY